MKCLKLGWNKLNNGTVIREVSKNIYEWNHPVDQNLMALNALGGPIFYKSIYDNSSDRQILIMERLDRSSINNPNRYNKICRKSSSEILKEKIKLVNPTYKKISDIKMRETRLLVSAHSPYAFSGINIYAMEMVGLNFESIHLLSSTTQISTNRFTNKTKIKHTPLFEIDLPDQAKAELLSSFCATEPWSRSFIEGLKFCLTQPIKT